MRVGRAGGRADWAQSATHHAATPPTPILVARRLDATAVRDPGCLVVWRARVALVAARCGSRAVAHLWWPLARDCANADRPRPARTGGEQCSTIGRARKLGALGGARAAGLSNVRSRPGPARGKPCGASCVDNIVSTLGSAIGNPRNARVCRGRQTLMLWLTC